MQPTTENHEISCEKKNVTHTSKMFVPTKYPRENILYPQNTHEKKFGTHRMPTRKKFWAHEIPTRKNFGPTKHPRKKISDRRNTHEGTMARRH